MRARSLLRVLLPLAAHALAREVDAATGVLLHTTLDLPGFVPTALALLHAGSLLRSTGTWIAGGALLWLALGLVRRRGDGGSLAGALEREGPVFDPLWLRPALTLLALGSLALQPTHPYALTLPVALTQDWGIVQDAFALAAIVALRCPAIRIPAPRASEVFFVAFLAYALLSPDSARRWEGHPGNEPKYLRMAVSIGHGLGLDVEGVSDAMERLTPKPLMSSGAEAGGTLLAESGRMLAALIQGPRAVGRDAIRATRITRQTIRGKEGGVYHVLAPGPSLLLAPLLRIDRALNLFFGLQGRLAITLLGWNALAAALVAALFLLLRDATGRPGLAAALAFGFGLAPPFLFYFFQFYPEMLGALALALVLRTLLFQRHWTSRTALALGLLLAALPWLHQKFLPVWGVLTLLAIHRAVDQLVTLRALAALVLPQAASLYLTALYNFAITGSVRPDALFLAWGPAGVSSERIGQGFLGLLLDARYGILPYAPLFAVGLAGLGALRGALLPALAYYLTVAAADNWAGAVCNLGRYFMPVAPWLVTGVGVVLARRGDRRGVVALVLMLAAWTALVSVALWDDPHAANDCAVLLAKAVHADGNQYLPKFFIRAWSDGAPGLGIRVAAWLLLLATLVLWLLRGRDASPARVLAVVAAATLVTAAVLEPQQAGATGPRFRDGIELRPGLTVFPESAIVRARQRVLALTAWVDDRPMRVTLDPVADLTGRRGLQEHLYRFTIGPGKAVRFSE